jgi:hypothetical protein
MKKAIDRHQWTHDGAEVLIAKCVGAHGETHGGFRWPLTVGAVVEAPDWRDDTNCGGGLHGWPWLFSVGDGKNPDYTATWLVFGADPADVRDLGGKVKARRGTVRAVGSYLDVALALHAGHIAWIQQASSGAASATGERGAASATGWSGAASATGERGAASANGWRGAASATGERGAASATGESGAASATGWSGAASATGAWGAASATGGSGAASVTGLNGRAQAGPYGCIALAWWNAAESRAEMRCARVGAGDGSDGLLKARVWYRLNDAGEFVEGEK